MSNYSELLGFFGELIVAGVILWELDENRRVDFLTHAASQDMYRERADIYEEFMSVPGRGPEKLAALYKSIQEYPRIKEACDRQILLFETLGGLARFAFFDRVLPLNQFVSVFPHAVVAFWYMLQPYIRERERRTGPWWAQNFRKFTGRCIDYILKQNERRVRIHKAGSPESEDFIISEDELRLLRSTLPRTIWRKIADLAASC